MDLVDAIGVSAGRHSACAVRENGSVVCWGQGTNGRLGQGDTSDSSVPVPVDDIANAISVSVGRDHACAVLATGTIQCWGKNNYGQVGNGATGDQTSPVNVVGIEDAVGVFAGGYHTCALRANGRVLCWGVNDYNQLGVNTGESRCGGGFDDSPCGVVPQLVNIDDVVSLNLGTQYTCAVRASGEALCWGRNVYGQLGDGTAVSRSVPTQVLNLIDARLIAAGNNHSCALLSTGRLHCWSCNRFGQLGDGSREDSGQPNAVADLDNVAEVALGSGQLALLTTGEMRCWGSMRQANWPMAMPSDRLTGQCWSGWQRHGRDTRQSTHLRADGHGWCSVLWSKHPRPPR